MPALLRPKLSKAMSDALRHHILKERERKRQEEEEADKAIERKKEEKERLRKKAEDETLSLEQTKVQIKNSEEKLATLQREKHELFLQLKKVLHEDDNRKKQREKEKSNILQPAMAHHQYLPAMRIGGPHLIVQSINRPGLLGEIPKFRPQTSPSHSVKRNRSPSPPLVQLYPPHPHTQGHYSQQVTSTFAPAQVSHAPYRQAHSTTQGTYNSQQHGSYAQPHSSYTSTTQASTKYQTRDPAYTNFNHSHYVQQQKDLGAQFSQGGYIHQPHQPRYLQSGSSHSGEPPSKQAAYSDESHYSAAKAQQAKAHQQHVRPVIQGHSQALHQQQVLLSQQQQQQQQQKPGVIQGYPPRRKQQESPVYAHKKPQQHQPQQQQQQHTMTSKSGYQATQPMRHSYQDRPYY